MTSIALLAALAFTLPVAPCPATTTPVPVRDLEPSSLRYQGTFAVGEQTMPITATLVVTAHPAGGWAVVERAELPRGLAVDSTRLERRTLVARERTIQQGPMQIALAFADSLATGTITTNGHSRPIAAALCGPLVADGAGAFLVVGRLPLAAGYRTTLRHLAVQKGAETIQQLAVLGSERAVVPAGTFDAWKVELSEAGSTTGSATTIWVDRSSLLPVKFSTSQGPVTITMELAR